MVTKRGVNFKVNYISKPSQVNPLFSAGCGPTSRLAFHFPSGFSGLAGRIGNAQKLARKVGFFIVLTSGRPLKHFSKNLPLPRDFEVGNF